MRGKFAMGVVGIIFQPLTGGNSNGDLLTRVADEIDSSKQIAESLSKD
jgi:hypothetical protein